MPKQISNLKQRLMTQKNLYQWLLAMLAMLPLSNAMNAQGTSGRLELVVSNEKDFINALGNERTIILREGTHLNLSKVLEDKSLFVQPGRAFLEDAANRPKKASSMIISEAIFDGRQLTLTEFHDLTIRGERDCQIVVEPRYAFVLSFINCRNISIECLTLGHTEEGYCMGGVVGLIGCDIVTIESCDMYGCGTYGIEAETSQVLRVFRSIIRDCSYGIMVLRDIQDAIFINCDFYRNREFGLLNVYENCRQIHFDDCRFAQNKGLLFNLETEVEFYNCEVHHTGEVGELEDYNQGPSIEVLIDDNPLPEKNIGPRGAIQ